MKSIKDLVSMADSMIVDELIATVKSVREFKPANPADQYPASKQGIIIKDDTGEIWVNVKNHTEYSKDMEGKRVKLSSYFDENKKTWFGVKKGSYEKDGKKHITLDVTKTGKIAIVEIAKEQPEPENTESVVNTGKSYSEVHGKKEEKTDWLAKERRELRAKAYNSALMTLYPILVEKLKQPDGEMADDKDIVAVINYYAEEAYAFITKQPLSDTNDEEIAF